VNTHLRPSPICTNSRNPRTRDEIILRNLTPRPPPADSTSLVVHLPVCGARQVDRGAAEHSTDLEQVWRK